MTKIYINQQPSRSVLSIVTLDSELPLSETAHTNLLRLCKETDVILLVGPWYTGVNFNKLTALYQACGWTEAGLTPEAFLSVLEYEKEIWERKHPGILYTSAGELVDVEKVQGMVASGISKPVMKCREMSSQEFYEIYKTGEKKRSWFWWFGGEEENRETDNTYTTYTTDSKVIILPPSVTNQIISFWKTSPEWNQTFKGTNLRPYIASVIKKLGVDDLGLGYDETEGI